MYHVILYSLKKCSKRQNFILEFFIFIDSKKGNMKYFNSNEFTCNVETWLNIPDFFGNFGKKQARMSYFSCVEQFPSNRINFS